MQELEKHIRQLMQDAEEEVPSRVWDAVAAGLDKKAAAPKVVFPLWRRLAVGFAAAAAVAAGVFLAIPRSEQAPQFDRVIAETVPALVEPALVAPHEIVLDSRSDRPARLAVAEAVPESTSVDDGPVVAENTADPVPEATARPSSVPSRSDGSSADTEAFNALLFADAQSTRRSGRFSVSAGGNVLSNNNPSSSTSRYMRSSAVPQTGIQEGTNRFYGIPVSVGVGIAYRFAPSWSVATGLVYTNLSRSFTGSFIEIDAAGSEVRRVTGDVDNVQHYLGIPLSLRYHFAENRNFRCYGFAGGTVERCLSDSYRIQAAETILWDKEPRGVQLSAAVGFGVEFALTDYLALYADPSLRYWFDCGQSKSIRTQQPLMAGLEVGLRFGW